MPPQQRRDRHDPQRARQLRHRRHLERLALAGVLLGIFTDLTKLLIPVIFYLLGTFVSLVQALVFTLLTMVYVGLAISHDH